MTPIVEWSADELRAWMTQQSQPHAALPPAVPRKPTPKQVQRAIDRTVDALMTVKAPARDA